MLRKLGGTPSPLAQILPSTIGIFFFSVPLESFSSQKPWTFIPTLLMSPELLPTQVDPKSLASFHWWKHWQGTVQYGALLLILGASSPTFTEITTGNKWHLDICKVLTLKGFHPCLLLDKPG